MKKNFLYWVVLVVCFVSMQSCRGVTPSATPTAQPITPQPTLLPTVTATPLATVTPTAADTATASPIVEVAQGIAFQKIPFDASRWKYYPLRDYVPKDKDGQKNAVFIVRWDKDNRAWVGTQGGLFQFDLSHQTWTSALDGGIFSIAFAKNSSVWMGLSDRINGQKFNGAALFDGKNWEYFPLPNVPRDIEIAGNGKVWASYPATMEHDAGVVMYDGHTWKNVVIGEGVLKDQVKEGRDDVKSLAVTPDQSVWFGTYQDGLFRLNGSQWIHYPLDTFTVPRFYFGEQPQVVKDLEVAPDGTLWGTLGMGGGAIIHFDGQAWETYPYPTRADSALLAVAVSKEGRIWVGEDFGRVLAYMEYGQWYTFQDLPFHSVYDISIGPDQSVWVSTYYGLYVYYPGK